MYAKNVLKEIAFLLEHFKNMDAITILTASPEKIVFIFSLQQTNTQIYLPWILLQGEKCCEMQEI